MRFFGTKQKSSKPSRDTQSAAEDHHFPTPIHAQYTKHPTDNPSALYPNNHPRDNVRQSHSDDQPSEVVSVNDDATHSRVLAPSRASTLPSNTSPTLPSSPMPRSSSPYSFVSTSTNRPASIRDRESSHLGQVLRRKPHMNAPVALGILKALDPTRQGEANSIPSPQANSGEKPQPFDNGQWDRDKETTGRKERRGFWGGGREGALWKDWSREKDQKDDAELTRMIGYLTATASEDWILVLEVCDRASSNGTSAKEAVRALRRELKHGEPPAQLSAARLWAIMSRNCSDVFFAETASRKFITTVEELITSSRTSPVVRERVLDVVAAIAFNSPKDSGVRSLWRRVKPIDKPEEGVPFDSNDEMINPPTNIRQAQYSTTGFPIHHSIPAKPPLANAASLVTAGKRRSPTGERIIPVEEDIRRLFQECHIGIGNAALLSDALAACKPEALKTDPVISEFYAKCRASQELIYLQIPWATAGAERSRVGRSQIRQRPISDPDSDDDEQTTEERLLGELLKANEEILSVLKQYDDLERVALERRAEDLSRKIARMDPKVDPEAWHHSEHPQGLDETASSRSPSPSIQSDALHSHSLHSRSQTSLEIQAQLLAPPPAPHGPRSPLNSRVPSMLYDQRQLDAHTAWVADVQNTGASVHLDDNSMYPIHPDLGDPQDADGNGEVSHEVVHAIVKPSAKALGKRRLVETIPSGVNKGNLDSSSVGDERNDSELEEDGRDTLLHPPVKYIYDAAAERTQQRLREATAALMVNGVH